MEDPDAELVRRAQQELPRRTSAYNELVRRHSGYVFRRAYGILRSEQDAEDVAQEVFLATYHNLPKFEPDRAFLHWLSTVTLNACRMSLRRRSQEQRRRTGLKEEPGPRSVEQNTDPTLRRVVLELLDELDPSMRIPLLLRHVNGYSHKEIAQELELGESAVRMRVSRGAKRLRELYEQRQKAALQKQEDKSDG